MITLSELNKIENPLEKIDALMKLGFYQNYLWDGFEGVDFKVYKRKGVWYVKSYETNWKYEKMDESYLMYIELDIEDFFEKIINPQLEQEDYREYIKALGK